MTTFFVPVRIGKRAARYKVLATDESAARAIVTRSVAMTHGASECVLFTGPVVAA